MELLGNWNSVFSQLTERQIDHSVSMAAFGDMIEFSHPLSRLSLWGIYVGEGHVIHFGVGDENMTQKACRSFLHEMVPKSKGNRVLKKTTVCTQRVTDIKVPLGTHIRVNNSKHDLVPAPLDRMRKCCDTFLNQEFKYDLMNFNSEHFATFVRFGHAMCNQNPFKNKNGEHVDTTQTLQMIMQQRMETEVCSSYAYVDTSP